MSGTRLLELVCEAIEDSTVSDDGQTVAMSVDCWARIVLEVVPDQDLLALSPAALYDAAVRPRLAST